MTMDPLPLSAVTLGLLAALLAWVVRRRPSVPRPPPGPPWVPDAERARGRADALDEQAADVRADVLLTHAEDRAAADAVRGEVDAADTLDELLRVEREERA